MIIVLGHLFAIDRTKLASKLRKDVSACIFINAAAPIGGYVRGLVIIISSVDIMARNY